MMVSVIIPLFNAENTIERALESVLLQEDFFDFEIIVVDDGSTDGGAEKVGNYISEHPEMNIQFVSQENQGVSAARNAGLRLSKGKYIALLDADDEWLPNKTKAQIPHLLSDKFDMIGSGRNSQKILWPYIANNNKLSNVSFQKLLIRNEIAVPSIIFRRKVLENTGYFNENQNFAEDHNFLLRASAENKIAILHENLVITGDGKRSFGVSGLSANLKEMHRGFNRNLLEMYHAKRISWAELLVYRIFYKFKYILLILRKNFGL